MTWVSSNAKRFAVADRLDDSTDVHVHLDGSDTPSRSDPEHRRRSTRRGCPSMCGQTRTPFPVQGQAVQPAASRSGAVQVRPPPRATYTLSDEDLQNIGGQAAPS